MRLLPFLLSLGLAAGERVQIAADGAASVAPLRVNGLVAAVFSPFDKDSNLNISVVTDQAEYLKATGVEWVFVSGTTGESLSLSMSERKELTVAWIKTGINVIVHVGAECMSDAQELARHAVSSGAKAIGAMPPVFFKPANAQALALTMSRICAAAPTLPCYYYHIPSMTGYAKPMLDFVEAMAPLSPNFAGIKYTGLYTYPGFMDAQRIVAYQGGRFEVLGGREDMMLEALSVGITGFVGSQFNHAGDLFNKLRSDFLSEGLTKKTQDHLRGLQLAAAELIAAWQAPEGVNGNKEFMNLAGVNVGNARLPSLPVTDATRAKLKGSLGTFCSDAKIAALGLRICGSA